MVWFERSNTHSIYFHAFAFTFALSLKPHLPIENPFENILYLIKYSIRPFTGQLNTQYTFYYTIVIRPIHIPIIFLFKMENFELGIYRDWVNFFCMEWTWNGIERGVQNKVFEREKCDEESWGSCVQIHWEIRSTIQKLKKKNVKNEWNIRLHWTKTIFHSC